LKIWISNRILLKGNKKGDELVLVLVLFRFWDFGCRPNYQEPMRTEIFVFSRLKIIVKKKTYIIVGLLADEADLAVDALPGLLVDPVRQVLGIVQTTRMH
jgi:hypothetical protein